MKYEYPLLPEAFLRVGYLNKDFFDEEQMRQYAEQAVAPLLAEIERLHGALDKLLQHCPDAECGKCAQIICPKGNSFHFHHDGCPSCEQNN